MVDKEPYPRLIKGTWVGSPLEHLMLYVNQGYSNRESYVAVPIDVLLRASKFKECGVKKVFDSDEDGPIDHFEATCRKELGHDREGLPEHVRKHYNGYYTWYDEVKDKT